MSTPTHAAIYEFVANPRALSAFSTIPETVLNPSALAAFSTITEQVDMVVNYVASAPIFESVLLQQQNLGAEVLVSEFVGLSLGPFSADAIAFEWVATKSPARRKVWLGNNWHPVPDYYWDGYNWRPVV